MLNARARRSARLSEALCSAPLGCDERNAEGSVPCRPHTGRTSSPLGARPLQTATFLAVAAGIEELQVLRLVAAAYAERDDVVELQ